MKRNGILNADLLREITAARHLDSFVICDIGFPVPKDATLIDISLIQGIPSVRQVLSAILNEIVVEEITLMDRIGELNAELDMDLIALFNEQKINYLSFPDFREKAKDAKFFVRTGEASPCSNIHLVSASGVQVRVDQLDVAPVDL